MKTKIKHLLLKDAAVIFAACFLIAGFIFYRANKQPVYKCAKLFASEKCIYELEVATTTTEWEKGLSGRKVMAKNKAMLFDFKGSSRQCMWMKDMEIPLDIAWLDQEGRAVKVMENVSPSTYPADYCADDTAFVLEARSGTFEKHAIKTGTVIRL